MSDFSEMSVMKMIFFNWNSLNFLIALFPYFYSAKILNVCI